MLGQLTTIWKFRHFWMSLVTMDLRTRYRRSILGIGWSLMNPIMMTVVFCVVFSKLLGQDSWRDSAPYYLAGITLFDFVRACALGGCTTFFRNESYIRQCPLPLAIYTLRTVLGAGIHFLIGLTVVILLVLVLHPAMALPLLKISWILVPALILLFLFCWSISILSSFMTVYFQDTQQLLEVIFQVFFFLTPIIYPAQLLLDHHAGILIQLNPVVTFFQLTREPILSGTLPTAWAWSKAAIVATMFVTMAMGVIARLEKKLIFHL